MTKPVLAFKKYVAAFILSNIIIYLEHMQIILTLLQVYFSSDY